MSISIIISQLLNLDFNLYYYKAQIMIGMNLTLMPHSKLCGNKKILFNFR